jgi:hypothetical protein
MVKDGEFSEISIEYAASGLFLLDFRPLEGVQMDYLKDTARLVGYEIALHPL